MRGLHREGALVGASQTAKGKVFMTTKAAQARNILGELDHRIGLDHYVEDRAFFWHELFFVQSIEEYLLFLWLEADDAEMQGDVALLQMKQRVATGSRGPLTAVSIVRLPHLPSPPQKNLCGGEQRLIMLWVNKSILVITSSIVVVASSLHPKKGSQQEPGPTGKGMESYDRPMLFQLKSSGMRQAIQRL
jgi:hypothetical protein